MKRTVAGLAAGCLAVLAVAACTSANDAGSNAVQVLSNRADLISGGDALVQVAVPAGVDASKVTLALNGQDVTGELTLQDSGDYLGLVTGLLSGNNELTVKYPDGSRHSTTVVDHPNGGPLVSGPQFQPWTCQSGAVDAQCNQPASYSYYYQSTDPKKYGLQPYDPENPPSDVADTTTDQGVSLPFIVRVETGYMDRDQYRIAVLYQLGKSWSAVAPQSQFNHKLLITHGASCGMSYEPGNAPSVINYQPANLLGIFENDPPPISPSLAADSAQYALGKGFAVMSTALDNSGHDCNVAIQAESLIMAKEHLIEHYGTLRYTIGTGCSGGSLAQQWIANAYPGVYQGILPTCSFPDAWSSATQIGDFHLLNIYFGNEPGISGTAGVKWTTEQKAAVEGNAYTLDAIASDIGFFPAIIPTEPCPGLPSADQYDPVNNPSGARCSIGQLGLNLFGPRPPEVWNSIEQSLGHGFAGLPVDNSGVQYGLEPLQQGTITPEQFLDLNEKIGGVDIDFNPSTARIVADEPALANAYRSGMINEANNMGSVAIIDCRGPDPGFAHDAYRAFAMRARLDRANGTHANQAIWEGPLPIVADTQCNQTSLIAMDNWLSLVEEDTSDRTLAQKIIADKPEAVTDECWSGGGDLKSHDLCGQDVVPIYGTPRTAAGQDITTDANKCQLKPLDRNADYGPVAFTDAQWSRMQALYPDGVCDFSKRGVNQQDTVPWLTYQDDAGDVIYGGKPLPPPPAGSGGGWASPAFRVFGGG